MNIIVSSDIEIKNGLYYYDTVECCWFGHWRSHSKTVCDGYPKNDIIQAVLTKVAIKDGYPRDIFKKKKVETTVIKTETVVQPKTEKPKKKPVKKQSSSFISLF